MLLTEEFVKEKKIDIYRRSSFESTLRVKVQSDLHVYSIRGNFLLSELDHAN